MDAFLWNLSCIVLFTLGFVLLFHSSDRLTKCLQWISCRFNVHPVILGVVILAMKPQLTVLSTTAALHHLPYLSIGSIIGSGTVSLSLSLALPLLLFREDPYLKLMAENVQKNEKLNVPSFYLHILCLCSLMVALGALPFVASFSYNILLIALINLHFFGAFIVQNFLKYHQSQTVDIHIEPKLDGVAMDRMSELKEERTRSDDVFFDDDTDEYDAVASSKEDYDQILDDDDGGDVDPPQRVCIDVDVVVDDDEVPMTVEMVDLTKTSKSITIENMMTFKMDELEQNGGPKVLSALCYAVLVVVSGWICVFAASQLIAGGGMGVLNEDFFGYIAVPLLTNMDTVAFTVAQIKEERPSGYSLRIGHLVASTMWSIGFVFAVCGVMVMDMPFRAVDRINAVLLAVTTVYVSMIIRFRRFKRVHGVGSLALFGAYLFVNMTIGEIE